MPAHPVVLAANRPRRLCSYGRDPFTGRLLVPIAPYYAERCPEDVYQTGGPFGVEIVYCSDVSKQWQDLVAEIARTHGAIEASGVGASDPSWLSAWQAWASLVMVYGGTVSNCSEVSPLAPKPSTIRDQLNTYTDELASWQTQAIGKGIQVPGGVHPKPPEILPLGSILVTVGTLLAIGVGLWFFFPFLARLRPGGG